MFLKLETKVKRFFIKGICLILMSLFNLINVFATHNRAGEITYVQLSDLTYEITVTTFTYSLSLADRNSLVVEWGDNTTSVAQRVSRTSLPNFYQQNVYKAIHTFPGPGIYRIVVQDPNRNAGVKNIPNSVNVVFSISTILTVNPSMGRNNAPVLLNPPFDKAAFGYIFIHNPAAYDPDGDSLSYALATCTREDGRPIENYTLPPATNSIWVNPVTGDLIWDTPADTGIFNVAMEIQEWRNGVKIGVVVRDMQIEVYRTNNRPPVNNPLKDYCVEAGDTIDFMFSATDPNNDRLTLSCSSGIFTLPCPATFTNLESEAGYASARFRWVTCHEVVRNQPYDVVFKSEDDNSDIRLADISNVKIRVLAPAPKLLSAVPAGKAIKLNWENYGTDVIAGFSIYRREGVSTFVPDSCTSGVPLSLGFEKIGYVSGSETVTFSDNDGGQGLQNGVEYAYRIVAVYPNGTESKASNEITSALVSGTPVIRNVSVRNTDYDKGSIFISWQKPEKLDTIPANGPYEYIIYRAVGTNGTDYTKITSIFTANLNDTTYIDTLINTQTTGYIYRIELWNNAPANRFLIGDPSYASSLYLSLTPGSRRAMLSLERNVPWINTRYDIFRWNEFSSRYDSIASTNQLSFIDQPLENDREYCYLVRSIGEYTVDGLPKNIINFSQKQCVTPTDNEPPCAPLINVSSHCDDLYNTITWRIDDPICFSNIARYRIYYKRTPNENFTLIEEVNSPNIFTYRHYPGDVISGCYAVSAIDIYGNEGEKSETVCIDECVFYEIPNVFTPNGDGINDILIAKTSSLVEKVDFKLFNRTGMLIFSTDNPRIEWDGTYNGNVVSPGVYFYQCDVYEKRLSGVEQFHLSGFVHVITERGAGNERID